MSFFTFLTVSAMLLLRFDHRAGGQSNHQGRPHSCAHRDGERVIIDCIREVKPPFSPEQVIIDFVSVLKSYRCHRVSGDGRRHP
jgi:hypothetical protein